MSNQSEGGVWLIIASLVVGFGIWKLSNDENDKTGDGPHIPAPAISAVPSSLPPLPPVRPVGLIWVAEISNKTVWFVDADNVKGPRKERLVWIVEDHSKNKARIARKTRTLYHFDCDTGNYQTLYSVDYNKDGKSISTLNTPDLKSDNGYVIPQSNLAAVLEAGCRPGFGN